MEIKILQVFYGKDGLPYKDKDRQVHFPITGTGFLGASNTTKIKFYYDELDNLDETTWVAVSKLPNGKVGSRVLESYLDEELNEHYALLELDNYYTQYKGDVFISLQGYQGGVDFDYDEENSQYEIHGTPTIAATGSIKFTINYANQFVGSGQTDNINFQRILAALGTKLGMRAYSEHVEELPSEGSPDVFYVVNDEPSDPNLANIYVWNENTRHYIWVGDNTLDLGNYYTKDEGNSFETSIENVVNSVKNEVQQLASGSPKGTYETLSDLETAYPTGTSGIYIVLETGNWYYWNTTNQEWTSGGPYLSSDDFEQVNNAVENLDNSEYLYDVDFGTLSGAHEVVENAKQCHTNIIYITGNTTISGNATYIPYVWEYSDMQGNGYTGQGWQTSPYTLQKGHYYAFVFRRADNGVIASSDLTAIKNAIHIYTKLTNDYKQAAQDAVKVETDDRLSNPVMVATVAPRLNYDLDEFTIEKSGTNLVVTLPSSLKQIDFIRNGVFRTVGYTDTTITIPNFSALVFNVYNATFQVIDTNSSGEKPLENYNKLYYILLYNDNGYPKGEWAKYFAYQKLKGYTKYPLKIMSRQGEGYGYPDNSIEGVSRALNDGYDNVRISVAHTSDNIIYCTHSHEMQHNSEMHVLTIDGVAYNQDVDINSSTSDFIDTLEYKGYAIPKVQDMIKIIARNAKEVTFELKDSWDNTNLQTLINIAKYYSIKVVFSMYYNDTAPTLLTNLDDELDIALIFQYTDALAQTIHTAYKNKSKSIRFDCYFTDTINFNSVISYIHPLNKLKLGGSSITSTQLKSYLTYVDVVEYSGKISEIGLLS